MSNAKPTANTESTLKHALHMCAPLARWLIRSGVGYTEFTNALKLTFLREAYNEAQRIGQKSTDSSISLLSGLHRRDVNSLKDSIDSPDAQPINRTISMSSQVVGHWLASNFPSTVPFQAPERSFCHLVRDISNDLHPRSICNELKRLGAVSEKDGYIHLQEQAFIPKPDTEEAYSLFANNVSDHIASGVHNLTTCDKPAATFLEQSVFADELTYESVTRLRELSIQTWQSVMQKVLKEAIELDHKDANNDHAGMRFRVGVYVYADFSEKDKEF